jgi:hypothetical protein
MVPFFRAGNELEGMTLKNKGISQGGTFGQTEK